MPRLIPIIVRRRGTTASPSPPPPPPPPTTTARPSRRYRNWEGVSFAGFPIGGVRRIRYSAGVTRVTFAADMDRGPTAQAVTNQDPSFRVTTRERYALVALAAGSRGVFQYTHLDARSGSAPGGGAYQVVTNDLSMLADRPAADTHNVQNEVDIVVNTCFADSTTNPVRFSAL